MACDTMRKPNQTLTQRKEEVRKTVQTLEQFLASKQVTPLVGKNGAITFNGWSPENKNGVTDACAYRILMATGNAFTRMQIAKAEMLAGKRVSLQAIGNGGDGLHSHDGGNSWHRH